MAWGEGVEKWAYCGSCNNTVAVQSDGTKIQHNYSHDRDRDKECPGSNRPAR